MEKHSRPVQPSAGPLPASTAVDRRELDSLSDRDLLILFERTLLTIEPGGSLGSLRRLLTELSARFSARQQHGAERLVGLMTTAVDSALRDRHLLNGSLVRTLMRCLNLLQDRLEAQPG